MINRKSKVTVVISSLLTGVFLLSACSVNKNGITNAFENLGENLSSTFSENEDTDPEEPDESVAETAGDVTDETEIQETEDVEVTATPAPTSTPTPTPTPVPQRVDFSELTEDSLSDTIDVEVEQFEESAHAEDDDDIVLAKFEGERLLLSSETELSSVVSVNLMLDAFYMEAEGIYNRVVNEQYAAYALDPATTPDTITVNVLFDYYYNGRILAVVMQYAVTDAQGQITDESYEFYNYDLYTGQLLTPELISTDYVALIEAIKTDLAEQSEDDRARAADYEILFIANTVDEDGGSVFKVIASSGDELAVYTVDTEVIEEYLTRYARIVFNVYEAPSVEEEEAVEDEDELTEDEDEDTEETEVSETEETEETEPAETESAQPRIPRLTEQTEED